MDLDWGRGQGQKQRFTRVVMRNAPPGELGTDKERGYVLMHTHTPVGERNHFWRWIVSCKKDHMSGGEACRFDVPQRRRRGPLGA